MAEKRADNRYFRPLLFTGWSCLTPGLRQRLLDVQRRTGVVLPHGRAAGSIKLPV